MDRLSLFRRSGLWARAIFAAGLFGLLPGCGSGDRTVNDPWRPDYDSTPTGSAREHFDLGNTAVREGDFEKAAAEFVRSMELAPHSLKVHEAFVSAVKRQYSAGDAGERAALEALDARYEELMRSQPTNAALPYIRSQLWFYADRSKCRDLLVRATEVDPKFARAWNSLGVFAEGSGDRKEVFSYYQRAAELAPENARFQGSVAAAFMRTDWDEFSRRAEAIVDKFSGTEDAAKWLYWLGTLAPAPEESIEYFERSIRENGPAAGQAPGRWVVSAANGLFGVLQRESPHRAAEFANEWAFTVTGRERSDWLDRYRRQMLYNLGHAMRQGGRAAEALEVLEEVAPRALVRRSDETDYSIVREIARAYALKGDTARAVTRLLDILATRADAESRGELERLGQPRGQSPTDVLAAIWERRLKSSRQAPAFTLPDTAGREVSLSDYHGRVVLVNFWYPACGPCRGEFPYLEKVARRFEDRGFVVISINVHPEEAAEVGPFFQNTGYPFLPLQGDSKWALDAYGVRGTPDNFIIAPNGDLIARPDIYNVETQRLLEEWLEELYEYQRSQPTVAD